MSDDLMLGRPGREPHFSAFRRHAEGRPPPDDLALPTAVVPRPAFAEEGLLAQWSGRLERWRGDPRVGIAAVALVALFAGLLWYRAGSSGDPLGGGPTTTVTTAHAAIPAQGGAVFVHVAGAVATPGLYELRPGARVADALEAAGGPAASADLDRLNLAALLTDGQRVHLPKVGEADVPPADVGGPAGVGSGTTLVDLNTAGSVELESLPGIGPAIAGAIIDERARRGGFRTVDDLLGVRGIGRAKLEQIRPLVVV